MYNFQNTYWIFIGSDSLPVAMLSFAYRLTIVFLVNLFTLFCYLHLFLTFHLLLFTLKSNRVYPIAIIYFLNQSVLWLPSIATK